MTTDILNALKVFCVPGQVVELRALGVQGRKAVSEVFGDLEAMARRAAELDGLGAHGVYFTPNPIRPDLVGSKASCKAADVVERHWLLIDVDPARPAGVSASKEEVEASWRVLDRCRAVLDGGGLVNPVVALAGNSWHLCYPIYAPNDEASHDAIKATLKELAALCDDAENLSPRAAVDKSVHDAPRIWKLYGTTARKGPHQPAETSDPHGEVLPARPHRRSYLREGKPWDRAAGEANVKALALLLSRWQLARDTRRGRAQADGGTYGAAALRQELAAVAAAPVGDRNNQLNKSAFALGQLVAGGVLSRPEVEAALQAAGLTAGLDQGEVKSTVRSGLDGGAKEPRGVPGGGGGAPGGTEAPQQPQGEANGKPAKITFPAPIPASQLKEGPQAASLWKGLINRGAVTLLSALWKAGKTTLLTHLIRNMERGGLFCGLELTAGSVLYVTEESESRWAKRRDASGLRDHIDFVIRPFTSKPAWPQWLAFLEYLNNQLAARPRDLIVFDTLTNLWPVKDENDASQVQSALMPLHTISGTAGQLLIHHTRKGDGQEATAARGSGALPAFVDTILEFRRFSPDDRDDRRRVLTGYGRDEDTPAELVIELTDLDGYIAHGKRADVKAVDLGDLILPLLPADGSGIAFNELMAAWPGNTRPTKQAAFAALAAGVEQGKWVKSGRGVKGDPHRYHRKPPEGSQEIGFPFPSLYRERTENRNDPTEHARLEEANPAPSPADVESDSAGARTP